MAQIKCSCGDIYDEKFKFCPHCAERNPLMTSTLALGNTGTLLMKGREDSTSTVTLPLNSQEKRFSTANLGFNVDEVNKMLSEVERMSKMDVLLKVGLAVMGLFLTVAYCILYV